jgi:VanZ family protein
MEQVKKFSLIRWICIALWVAYAVLIFYLSSQPITDAESLFSKTPFGDKGAHIAEYFLFGVLTYLALRPQSVWHWSLALFVALAYAATDELHQGFVPTRNASFLDWSADALGIGVSALIYAAFIWSRRGTR